MDKIKRILNKHILKPSGRLGIPDVIVRQENPNIIFMLVTTLRLLMSYKLKLGIEVQRYGFSITCSMMMVKAYDHNTSGLALADGIGR